MGEQYTIKELAEAKGTSAPVRVALLAMETLLMQSADRIEALEEALQGISNFGKERPGHGYSCHLLAARALGDQQ